MHPMAETTKATVPISDAARYVNGETVIANGGWNFG